MLTDSQWYQTWLMLSMFITVEVRGQCQPVYQLECAACSLTLEKVCEISLEERLVEASRKLSEEHQKLCREKEKLKLYELGEK